MSEKIKIPDIERKEIQLANENEGVILLDPSLNHKIYVSKQLERKLNILLREITDRASLGYLAGSGAILSGFQGVGKTVLVKKLAKDLSAKIVVVDREMNPKQIIHSFEKAKQMSKGGENVLIFIDEIDSFGQKEYERFTTGLSKITALMTQLDGVDSAEFKPQGVYYVMAATNYLENVDMRLLRPGRIEELIEVSLPDIKARKEILRIHQRNESNIPHSYKISDEVVEYLARKTNGYTPADLRSLIKHCCINTEEKRSKIVSEKDAEKSLHEFITSVKRGLEYFVEPIATLDNVVGRELYKEFLQTILEKEEEAKILLYGPRGTSKTLIPEALANALEYNYVYCRGSELQDCLVGEGTKNIKKILQRAQMASPCVVLLDEIKGIVTARNTISHKDDETAYLNSLLSRPLPRVYLFITTNNPLEINETTLSRFEHKIFCELPTEEERVKFFRQRLNNGFNEEYKTLATKTDKFSFRDLENITRALNRIERRIEGEEDSQQRILEYIISKYVCENNESINWNAIRNHVGDSLEVEKFVYSITRK